MYNYLLIISYDGTNYFGWQKASPLPSIEEHLQKAISTILQEEVSLQAASRTDAGVHAKKQVVNFISSKLIDLKKALHSINQLLPPDIRALQLKKTHKSFHPSLDSRGKIYTYNISTAPKLSPFHRYSHWHLPKPLNLENMKKAASTLIGSHDFSAFTNQSPSLREDRHKTLFEITITQKSENFFFKISGKSFLYKMVRNIVGTIAQVGYGKISLDDLHCILKSKQRALSGVCAPACGLFLENVIYNNQECTNDIKK